MRVHMIEHYSVSEHLCVCVFCIRASCVPSDRTLPQVNQAHSVCFPHHTRVTDCATLILQHTDLGKRVIDCVTLIL